MSICHLQSIVSYGINTITICFVVKKNAFHAVEPVSQKMANICGTALSPNFSPDSYQMALMKPQLKGTVKRKIFDGKLKYPCFLRGILNKIRILRQSLNIFCFIVVVYLFRTFCRNTLWQSA